MQNKMSKLLAIACFFAGMSLGFLLSPAKNGFGCNSGNVHNYNIGKEDFAKLFQREI